MSRGAAWPLFPFWEALSLVTFSSLHCRGFVGRAGDFAFRDLSRFLRVSTRRHENVATAYRAWGSMSQVSLALAPGTFPFFLIRWSLVLLLYFLPVLHSLPDSRRYVSTFLPLPYRTSTNEIVDSKSWTTSASLMTSPRGRASDWIACSPVSGFCIFMTAMVLSRRVCCL